MQSLLELYKIGHGPSSSHTMGPSKLSGIFKEKFPQADKIKVILYGSLALTGQGHLTDVAISDVLKPIKHEIVFDAKTKVNHPNTVDFIGYKNGKEIGKMRGISIGGGSVKVEGMPIKQVKECYKFNFFKHVYKYCKQNKMDLYDYVIKFEGKEIIAHLKNVWKAMQKSIELGLKQKGKLPGKIGLERRAYLMYHNKDKKIDKMFLGTPSLKHLYAYAFACNETNASGGVVVTAPTCGACGTIPAVMYYAKKDLGFKDDQIIKALAVAGIIGNFFKRNGSVAGAEGGCQAEVGTACAMAAAGFAYLYGNDIDVIQHAAKIGITHHFGLTCDPVMGYVQIPCIERNATAAHRAIEAAQIAAINKDEEDFYDLDDIVKIAYITGKDLDPCYRETSTGGLAKHFKPKK